MDVVRSYLLLDLIKMLKNYAFVVTGLPYISSQPITIEVTAALAVLFSCLTADLLIVLSFYAVNKEESLLFCESNHFIFTCFMNLFVTQKRLLLDAAA